MNDQKVEDRRLPSCNVNQTFNYIVGAIAVLIAAAIYFSLLR
jgi:hypothetical protein